MIRPSLATLLVVAVGCSSDSFASPDAADASADTASEETGPGPVDATADMDATADLDAKPSPCAGPHLFCDDFDSVDASTFPPGKWSLVDTTNGSLSLSPSSVGPPNALLIAATPPDSAASVTGPSLLTTLQAVSKITCSFDMNVVAFASGGANTLGPSVRAVLANDASVSGWRIVFYIPGAQKTLWIQEFKNNVAIQTAVGNLTGNEWVHVEVNIGSNVTARLGAGSAVVLAGAAMLPVNELVALELQMRTMATGGAGEPKFLYDNVVCDAK